MIADELKARIEKATVTLTGKRGRGVRVGGNVILTAAHCVDWGCEYPMAQDFHFEEIETSLGSFRLAPYVVEPCLDIAVLGELDNQEAAFQREVELFDSFCEVTEPVSLCTWEYELFEDFPVHVYTHEGKWVTGTAKQCGSKDGPNLYVEFDDHVRSGTSGSAIVNDAGEIVGVISTAGGVLRPNASDVDDTENCCGSAPRPSTALPVWIVKRIVTSDRDLFGCGIDESDETLKTAIAFAARHQR